MKTLLAWIGGIVLILSFLGTIGSGDFVVKFSSKPSVSTEQK